MSIKTGEAGQSATSATILVRRGLGERLALPALREDPGLTWPMGNVLLAAWGRSHSWRHQLLGLERDVAEEAFQAPRQEREAEFWPCYQRVHLEGGSHQKTGGGGADQCSDLRSACPMPTV